MMEPLSTTPPVISTANITGSPLSTIGGILGAIAQYLGLNGATLPHDTGSWISFGFGLLIAIAGALGRLPTSSVNPTVR